MTEAYSAYYFVANLTRSTTIQKTNSEINIKFAP